MHNAVQKRSQKLTKVESFPQDFKDYISNRIKNGISPDVVMNTLPDKYKIYNN